MVQVSTFGVQLEVVLVDAEVGAGAGAAADSGANAAGVDGGSGSGAGACSAASRMASAALMLLPLSLGVEGGAGAGASAATVSCVAFGVDALDASSSDVGACSRSVALGTSGISATLVDDEAEAGDAVSDGAEALAARFLGPRPG